MEEPVEPNASEERPGTTLARAIAVALAVAITVGLGVHVVATRFFVSQAEERVQEELLADRGLHRYMQEVMYPEVFAAESQGDISHRYFAPQLFSSTFMTRTMHALDNEERARAGLDTVFYRLASENPRNPVNQADEHERELLRRFNADRSLKSVREIMTIDGKQYLQYALPFLETTEACLRCHGKREDAPLGLATRYPDGGGYGEKIDTIRALESIRVPIGGELRMAWALSGALAFGALAFATVALSRANLRRRVQERTRALTEEVNERRRAEEEIHRLKDELSGVVEAMPSALVGLDQDWRVTLWNHGAEAISGVLATDAAGRPVAELLPEMAPHIAALRARAQGLKLVRASEHAVVDRDGSPRTYEILHYPLTVNAVGGGVLRVDDTTDRLELEQQLAQTQRFEAIGTLAGGIAHDFNNILAAVEGYATLVLEQPIAPGVRQDVKGILEAARRAAALTRQILAFSRPVSQEPRPVRPSEIAREALRLLRATIPASVRIRARLESEALVIADPSDIHRVLVNLCTNASAAMKNGGMLDVEACDVPAVPGDLPDAPPSPSGRWVRLRVRDSGIGMSPEVKARIFEPFFTTRKDEGGTGMGLATVHGIVKRLGGAITVESAQGEGSTFTLYLPENEAARSAERTAEAAGPRGTERVLFVDDEPAVCQISARYLSSLGYRVRSFTSAPAALAAFEAAPLDWDIVVTDTAMPELSGDALARKVKALRPDLPVILCTGFSERISEEEARALGIDRFLLKPVVGAELSRIVRAVLEQART